MARTFRALEVESEFLSKSETKKELQNILEQLVEDLNYYSECQIPINDANTINLKLFPIYPDPPPVRDFQVPVCIIDLEMVMDKYCDLTMRRVVPRINGVNTIKKISELADVRVDLARSCVQHLLYYGCVKLVDIFQFSNVYAPKSHLNSMLNNIEAQNNCIDFVTLNGYPPVSFDRIFSLYCALKHELSVKDWIEDNEVWNHHIDVRINAIRRFFIYGVLKGYIFRIHKYPLIMQSSAVVEEELGYINGTIKEQKSYGGGMAGLVSSSVGKSVSSINYIPNNNFSISNIKRFLDGKHCFDELCTMFDCSSKELEELLKEKDKEKEICLRFLSF
ncbi:Nitrogen permease regulator 2 [Clydaea vesicula]|uniref:Nitrogen permease regulator 2 n=1 Tax=Clydaea vesicula TaxID=447962 RepID=A0AAD5XVI7_9FUNG|nr:Nitrogen permease regulator 2 [Clydaea vesicula]